jgi:hypothetical protein
MVGVGKTTVESYWELTLNPQHGGKVTASQPDGRVLSIQPDGKQEWRPSGTAGPFELATVDGQFLVYAYNWVGEPRIFKVSLIPNLPDLA